MLTRTRLFGEGVRTTMALAGTVLVMLLGPPLYAVLGQGLPRPGQVTGAVIAVCVYQLLYVAISLAVFVPASTNQLREFVVPRARRSRVRWLLTSSEPGVGLAVSSGALAMVAAVWVLPRVGEIAEGVLVQVVTVAGIGLIVGAWASMVVTYAIDYARKHLADGGLAFPGEPPSGFVDYAYFAVAVSTTFAASDVQVTSPRMRRTVIGHAVVAFAFNVVIVALTIAVIVS